MKSMHFEHIWQKDWLLCMEYE